MRDITIGRLRGGLCAIWRDDAGRHRHQLKARTRKEAEAEAVALFRAKAVAAIPAQPLVRDIWEAYVADLGEKTTARNMRYAGKAILPHFGAYQPQDITKALCQKYDAIRHKQGRAQGTVWTELGYLQSALNFALRPAPKIWRPAKPQTDKRILSPAECTRLIDAAHDPHVRLAIILMLGTAGRVGAILDLTWARIDFDRGVINLRLEDEATRKGRAVVPMNGSTRAALATARDAALSDYVIEYAGRQVGSVRKGVQNAITRAKLGHVRLHDLRHTAAVTMLANGVRIELVAQVLGHSNISVTFNTYGRFLPEHMQEAVDHLDFVNLRIVR